MGESLNGTAGLDVDSEVNLVKKTLEELRTGECSEKAEKVAMKQLGMNRFVQ